MATTLQIAGAAVITVGVGLIWIPAGVIVGGAFLLLIGLSLGR